MKCQSQTERQKSSRQTKYIKTNSDCSCCLQAFTLVYIFCCVWVCYKLSLPSSFDIIIVENYGQQMCHELISLTYSLNFDIFFLSKVKVNKHYKDRNSQKNMSYSRKKIQNTCSTCVNIFFHFILR